MQTNTVIIMIIYIYIHIYLYQYILYFTGMYYCIHLLASHKSCSITFHFGH